MIKKTKKLFHTGRVNLTLNYPNLFIIQRALLCHFADAEPMEYFLLCCIERTVKC